jgi:hypothetical protein
VSSELERILRDAREALPGPDDDATLQARDEVLAAHRRIRPRSRILVLAGSMLVAAVALGLTAGSLNAPTGTAAREPAAVGFVPEPGWFALQSPPPAVVGQQVVAAAANVAFAADDVVHGLVEPSGLPYSTLLKLPPGGIVIVTTMVPDTSPDAAPALTGAIYPKVPLPLHLRDGVQYLQWGAQIRPDQPLAQYQLRVSIRHYNVDVVAYFGTPRPSKSQLDEAQRQLDGLVVRPSRPVSSSSAKAESRTEPAASVIDRTYTCRTVILGGLYQLTSRAHAGIRSGSTWSKLAYAVAASGGYGGPLGLPNAPSTSLAWITAGAPSRETTVGIEAEVFPVLGGGTIGVNKSLCRPSKDNVELSSKSLRGGRVTRVPIGYDCAAPRNVLVRFRASVAGSSVLRQRARLFLATNAPAREAKLAVRTPAGKLLAYADVAASGKARLFTAKACRTE